LIPVQPILTFSCASAEVEPETMLVLISTIKTPNALPLNEFIRLIKDIACSP
jgi:hypothetical protein